MFPEESFITSDIGANKLPMIVDHPPLSVILEEL